MSQIMKKWIGDHQVDSTKIDPSYKYTMQGLNIPVTGTFGIGVVNPPVPEISNPGAGALRLQSTAGGGRTYELNSDVVGNFNIKDVNASANRLSITPSGVINISNAMIGQTTFSTLTVTGDTFLHDASVSGNLEINGVLTALTDTTVQGNLCVGTIGSLGDLNISPDGELYLIAGGDGIITTEGALEIGGHLNVVGAFPFWATGDATVSGLLTALTDTTVQGNLCVGTIGSLGDLNISPDGELYLIAGGDGIITTEGALEIGGHLNVVGAFPFWATGDATVSGLLTALTDTTVQGDLYVGADASVIGDIWMGSHLYTHLSLSIEPTTDLNLAPSTDLYLNPGSNLTTCYSDFTCVGEIRVNNLIMGSNAFRSTGAVINSGALGVNNGDINGGQNFYLSKTAYITDTTTGHLYDSGDASIIGDIWMGSHLYTHQSLTIEPNTDLNLAPSTVLYLNPGSGDTTSYGNITIAGAKAGIALTCTAGNIVTAYDMSCGGALRGNGLWMNGYVGDTTDAVIGSRTFHFISGILTSIS